MTSGELIRVGARGPSRANTVSAYPQEDASIILRDDVRPALDALARHGLLLDVAARARHLPLLPELAQRHPTLAMVIDHGAKPAIARGEFEPWARDIAVVARETRMYCKLSGLATEASPDWADDDLRPYADHLLECFGAGRLKWGSDWPVVDLAGGLSRWRDGFSGEAVDAFVCRLAWDRRGIHHRKLGKLA